MTEDPLKTPVQFVPGVGPARAERLTRLGLETVEDLLWYLPRDLVDLTEVRGVSQLEPDVLQTVRGRVIDIEGRRLSGGRSLITVLLDCGDGMLCGNWFNQHWVLGKMQLEQAVLFSGKPRLRAGRWEMAHPRLQWIEPDDLDAHGGLLPRYPLTEGLAMDQLRRIIAAAVERYVDAISDLLPGSLRKRYDVVPLDQALRDVHHPPDVGAYEAARRRLVFDDLLEFQLALAFRRRAWKRQGHSPQLPTSAKVDARIRRRFPFSFTPGQEQAISEICVDLDSDEPMHRLLQADVGAGKTAVALYAMLVTVAAGRQAVMMAPTELLARQHWDTVESILAASRVERVLLIGQMTAAERRDALEAIGDGSVHLVIGTHAVIQRDVRFANLGLAVIDEQHKFGVVQRSHFSATDDDDADACTPHVLVMTATPIPRSLCLTQFGDLDVTTIEDLPPGRQPVVTSVVRDAATRERAWEFIRRQLAAGRQAFVVCPRIEPGEELAEGMSVEATFEQLASGELGEFDLGLVHGQLETEVKIEAMESFRAGRTAVLVATTVVEVGVDVPNATMMVVYQAERFGLSQLHQLRGRISRGTHQGYCFLFAGRRDEEVERRLAVLESIPDGFGVAEADFAHRGPGDVLGTRQHGELPLKVADLVRDADVLAEARGAAFDLVAGGEIDRPELAALQEQVLERFGELMQLPRTG